MSQWPWYVIRVRSNHERIVTTNLRERGFETYLPVYRSRRKWADRIKEIDMPAFPGYTFCRLDVQVRLPILQTPGVVSILGSRNGPIPVEDSEIESVRRMLVSGLPVGTTPFIQQGQRVIVEQGPLAGMDGFVVEVKARFRLVVSIPLLNRSVYAEVDSNWLRPVDSFKTQRRHAHGDSQVARQA